MKKDDADFEHTNAILCEVTGQLIPRDDVVIFQGKWVGAEGKAILLDLLRSGGNASSNMMAASITSRVIGNIIDSLVVSIVAFIIHIPLSIILNSNPAL